MTDEEDEVSAPVEDTEVEGVDNAEVEGADSNDDDDEDVDGKVEVLPPLPIVDP